MQAYGAAFARIYAMRWQNFARQTAPRIQNLYESTLVGQAGRTLLDVCCGTGPLAMHFLEAGYRVIGIDLSEAMLGYARAAAAPYVLEGRAQFLQADAAHFQIDERVSLAVSTFDALNHLPDLAALRGCFASIAAALLPGGMLVFDLNTRVGLHRWCSINVEDTEDLMLVTRGLYDDAAGRAYTYISGFLKVAENHYERFEETAYNTAFDLTDVEIALRETGFGAVRFCRPQDLATGIADPEGEPRIFVVAEKG